MDTPSLLRSVSSEDVARELAPAFGVDAAQAQVALGTIVTGLSDRIERNTLSRGGIADIFDLLSRPGAGAAARPGAALNDPQIAAAGNGALDVLLGSKHASRGLAARAAAASGLDEETVKRMLPAVASLLIGVLQSRAMPQIEKSLARLPAMAGGPLAMPGEISRDATADARPRGSEGEREFPPQRPLPIPGDTIPGTGGGSASRFPDLPDIIRRGGRDIRIPDDTPGNDNGGSGGGGSLDNIIRDILANALGFRNGGIIAFIVKMLLSRWFLGLIGRILRGVLGQRR